MRGRGDDHDNRPVPTCDEFVPLALATTARVLFRYRPSRLLTPPSWLTSVCALYGAGRMFCRMTAARVDDRFARAAAPPARST